MAREHRLFVLAIALAAATSSAQRVYAQSPDWGAWDHIATCSDLEFYFSLSKVPGNDNHQRARLRVVNHGSLPVAVRFKANFTSADGDRYESNLETTGRLASNGDTGSSPNLMWVPFKDSVSITRKTPLAIAQYFGAREK